MLDKTFYIGIILLIAFILNGCSYKNESPEDPPINNSSSSYPGPTNEFIDPKDIKVLQYDDIHDPEPGKGAIGGVLYSFTINIILADTNYYLTPSVGDEENKFFPVLVGPIEEKGDISGITDGKGYLNLTNISPGNYFLIVEAPYNWSVAVNSPTDQEPYLITVSENEKKALGILYVSWP